MNFEMLIFYVFSAITLVAALRVITARNPVHAALFLVLAFFSSAAIWMLLRAEFLAITLVLVYVGAVMVLFLFVVMMLDVNIESLRKGFWRHFPVAATMGALIALELAAVLMGGFRSTQPIATFANSATDPLAQASNTKELGILIYTQYLYPLEVAAVILLVAIIAAIALTLRSRKDSKYQDPSEQVRVKASDRLQLVKMEPVRPAPPKTQEQP